MTPIWQHSESMETMATFLFDLPRSLLFYVSICVAEVGVGGWEIR